MLATPGLATLLGVRGGVAVALALIGCACLGAAMRNGSALALGRRTATGPDRTVAPSQPEARTDAVNVPYPVTAPLATADWERALLTRLPGLSFVVQQVTEGPLTDWLLLAGHAQDDLAQTSAGTRASARADMAVDPTPPSRTDGPLASPELLSHWLARHPQFRPVDVVAALQALPAHSPDTHPAPRWRVLPLGGRHSVLWLAPGSTPAVTAVASPSPSAPALAAAASGPAENERESIAYTVSHDLRAPIRVIEGFTRIVREDYGHLLDRIGNDHLDRVLGAASRMNSMIDALLALSRITTQALAREPVALSKMAHQVIDELRMQAPARVVQVTIEPDLATLGDPAMLRSVLENLLGNAWKYTSRRPEGRIEFGLTALARVRPGVSASQDRPVYFVRDNGAGFDMRFAERLFGAFQRLHSASEFAGTGVGLASVRRIISRHGGEIWAQATVDQGACFYFTLP